MISILNHSSIPLGCLTVQFNSDSNQSCYIYHRSRFHSQKFALCFRCQAQVVSQVTYNFCLSYKLESSANPPQFQSFATIFPELKHTCSLTYFIMQYLYIYYSINTWKDRNEQTKEYIGEDWKGPGSRSVCFHGVGALYSSSLLMYSLILAPYSWNFYRGFSI